MQYNIQAIREQYLAPRKCRRARRSRALTLEPVAGPLSHPEAATKYSGNPAESHQIRPL